MDSTRSERVRAGLAALLDQRVTIVTVSSLAELGAGKPRRYRCDHPAVGRKSR